MEECIVKRDGKRDLSFKGEVLASVSSRKHSGPEQNRWTEITIYRTDTSRYVVAVVGRTQWQGEEDRFRAEVCDTPEAVLSALEQEDAADGRTYLSRLAKEALEEAARTDSGFDGLLLEKV